METLIAVERKYTYKTHKSSFKFTNNFLTQCCDPKTGNFVEPESNEDKSVCFPIKIPPKDKLQGDKNCINFVRSCGSPRIDCNPGPKEQMNQITHWLDASNVYGSSYTFAKKLRTMKDGLLKVNFRSKIRVKTQVKRM